jgi:hypothetical protein
MGHRQFGEGGATYVHPAIACAMLLTGVLILFLPRKRVIAPVLAAAFLVPIDQVIVVGPFHFMMLRVVILLGWIRLLGAILFSKSKIIKGGVNSIDKAVAFWTISSAATLTLLWQQWGALVNCLGTLYTVLGVYFLLRFLIQDQEDVDRAIRVLACVAAVIAFVMAIEQATGRNPYAVLGGGLEAARQALLQRDNRFRAMGPFAHPILAGTFGAILVPLFIGLWWKNGGNRVAATAGVIAGTIITVASVSSTPALAYVAGLGALCLWPLRRHLRMLRWGLVASLIALHAVMKAPVWALVGRVDVVGGSSGYHRYMLVDQFIRRFGDWWLLGTKSNADWGWDMWDLANQYVAVGERSGLLPFVFFLAIIVFGFKYLGIARKASEGNKKSEISLWALNAALFSNVVAFFGIGYFDQTQVAWYALLAMISTATLIKREKKVQTKGLSGAVSTNSHVTGSPSA